MDNLKLPLSLLCLILIFLFCIFVYIMYVIIKGKLVMRKLGEMEAEQVKKWKEFEPQAIELYKEVLAGFFYEKCMNAGVDNPHASGMDQRMHLLAKQIPDMGESYRKKRDFSELFAEKYGYNKNTVRHSAWNEAMENLEKNYLDPNFDVMEAYSIGKKRMIPIILAKEKARLDEIRQEEINQQKELNKYADLIGREKRIAMLRSLKAQLYDTLITCKEFKANVLNGKNIIPKEREHNWALAGGVAAGLGGSVVGAMTAADLQQKNASIRARNDARADKYNNELATLYAYSNKLELETQEKIKELDVKIEKTKTSLIGELNEMETLERVKFGRRHISFTETGAFKYTIYVSLEKRIEIYENIFGVVDGVIKAVVTQGGKEASVLLTAPVDGIDTKEIKLEGIGITDAGFDAKKECKVKFEPYHLWTIEAT